MKTVTNAAFVAMIEDRRLSWPPFQLGPWIYARLERDPTEKIGELHRTAVPA